MIRSSLAAILLAALIGLSVSNAVARGINQTPEAFINEVFDHSAPKPKTIWLTGTLKKEIAKILQHPYPKLRVKYWLSDNRSAWVLDEIGKEKPITVGIVIDSGKISRLKVLAFRESRGWEVEQPFFTRQFQQVGLTEQTELDSPIDGITGATLSVRALTKLGRMALLLHQKITNSNQ